MSSISATYFLFRSKDCSFFQEVEAKGLDLLFPIEVRGWSDVLDCRIPPYTEHSLEENCRFAKSVRKYYILVTPEYADNLSSIS